MQLLGDQISGMKIKGVLTLRSLLTARFLAWMLLLLGPAAASIAAQSAGQLTIYEIAGAGALSGANYRQDTIILFNPTASAVACANCAIQLHSGSSISASSAWTVYKLPSFTIEAGGYYMISASDVNLATYGAVAPIPYDYQLGTIEGTAGTGSQNILSSTLEVVALTNTQSVLATGTTSYCVAAASQPNVVDLVGYGSSFSTTSSAATPALCYAGSGPAYYDGTSTYGRQMGVTRKNRCINTNDNSDDFVNTGLTYFNSSTTPTPCSTGTPLSAAISVNPAFQSAGGAVTFTAAVTPATNPASTGITATLHLDSPYFSGSAVQMYDDGTNGDAVAGDGIYTVTTTLPSSTAAGYAYPVNVTVADAQGNSYTGSTTITVPGTSTNPSQGNNSLRIVAFYGAGNLSHSMYGRDTVILFNPSQSAITMNNWSLQTGSTTGSFTSIYKLPVATIPPGGYYAITGSADTYISGSGCTSQICNTEYAYDYELDTIEGKTTSTENILSSTNTTVAIANTQTALGTCPLTSKNLVDMIGVAAVDGSTSVTCFAGSGPAPYTPTTLGGQPTNVNGVVYAYATVRKNKCVNTFNNEQDYMLGYIDFENSQSTPTPCPAGTQLYVNSATVAPVSAGLLDPVTITAQVDPGASSSGVSVTADLSNIGLSTTQQLYDDGSHGDQQAGDGVYTLSTAPTAGTVGPVLGLIVTATDSQNEVAHNTAAMNVLAGIFTITTKNASATVTSGGVATFPLTFTALHGYNGVLGLTCTGGPNANDLGIPTNTSCVMSPSEVTLSTDGTVTVSVAIATGLTTTNSGKASSSGARGWPVGLLVILSAVPLAICLRRNRRLFSALMVVAGLTLAMSVTACTGSGAGLANLKAQSGTYTYTVTATDSALSSITQSITLTVNVQ